jgi:signal transduction histidine kinase
MNLCLNAVQAMPSRKGEIKISLAEKRFNSQEANKMGLSTSGDYIFLTVEDNGKGMDEATIQRAFEPYFSTKSVGEGTGLGLTIVHNIVRDHEGKITIESEVGKARS